MLLLVGLGNPGDEYARTRHNVGFMAVEEIARQHDMARWRRSFQGLATRGVVGGEDALLLLPGTFMNESGRAVAEAAHFYKLSPADIIVFHDEKDFPPGRVRVKTGGTTDAGHNGLLSISSHISHDYRRVRIGIGHPPVKGTLQHYVLGNFAKGDRVWLEALLTTIADNVALLVHRQDSTFQNKVHLAMVAKGFGEETNQD
jgi:PTH1 family peptidyl-tRNA hydrolase